MASLNAPEVILNSSPVQEYRRFLRGVGSHRGGTLKVELFFSGIPAK
jgi:hypothetical protein